MNWGAFAAISLMCFIIGLAWEAFDFYGAMLGRSTGGWFACKAMARHEAEQAYRDWEARTDAAIARSYARLAESLIAWPTYRIHKGVHYRIDRAPDGMRRWTPL